MEGNVVPPTTPWGYRGYGNSKSPDGSEPIKSALVNPPTPPTNKKPVQDGDSKKRDSAITWYSNSHSAQGSLAQNKDDRPNSGAAFKGTCEVDYSASAYRQGAGMRIKYEIVTDHVQILLKDRLREVEYDPVLCKALSQRLAAEIMERIRHLYGKRNKLVAVVSIGSLQEYDAMNFGCRCLWSEENDSWISIKFVNHTLFAIVMIYSLHFE